VVRQLTHPPAGDVAGAQTFQFGRSAGCLATRGLTSFSQSRLFRCRHPTWKPLTFIRVHILNNTPPSMRRMLRNRLNAGALGIPVWVLLTWVPDWRWLLDRDDSPWYPLMRLFRQTARGDWNGVLERVRLELRALNPLVPSVRGSRPSAPHSAASQLHREVTRCRILGQTNDRPAADIAPRCSRRRRDDPHETEHPPRQGRVSERVKVGSLTSRPPRSSASLCRNRC
jgi:hypothetical protein